jgi:hypothetical protein
MLTDNHDGTAALSGMPDAGTAGTYTITLTASNEISPDATQVFTLTVNLQSQSITFPALGSVPFSPGVSVTLAATASSGLPVAYAVVSGPGTLSGHTLTVTAAWDIVIEATQEGDGNYSAAAPVRQTITVTPGSQSVTFPIPAPVGFATGSSCALTATASSGLPITYTVVSGHGTLSGNMLIATGPGTVVVRADQTGDGNYAPAAPVEVSVVFRPVGQTAFSHFTTSGDTGGVTVHDPDGTVVSSRPSPGRDGARAAEADVTGDGIAETIASSGPGVRVTVSITDGATGRSSAP